MKKLLLLAFIFLSVQVQAQCWKQIDGGNMYMAGIKLDGSLWSWGYNSEGQLGNGSSEQNNVPLTKMGTDNNWKSVSTGIAHTMAIKTDGTLWGTGRNSWGQLGIGTNEDISTLVQIGNDSDWVSVYCKVNITFAIKTNGTLWACGSNNFGQLGDGTTIDRNIFTQIGTDTDWKMAMPSYNHTVAVKTNGTLWTWGVNTYGQLGNGTTGHDTGVTSPIQIGTSTDWSFVDAGVTSSLGLKTDGTLWSWGFVGSGELGYLYDGYVSNPTQIGSETWNSFKISDDTVLAIKADGTLWGWGDNDYGNVGDGTYIDRYAPVLINSDTNWKSVIATGHNSFALNSNNNLWGCGANHGNILFPGSSTATNNLVFIDNCALANLKANTIQKTIAYPNPVNNILYIQASENNSIENILIIDITGKTVLQQHFPTGVYF